MEYTIGTKVFKDWEIVAEIGEGSYGKVFEVKKEAYGVTTKAALKMIRIPKSISDIKEAYSEGMDEKSVTSYFEGIVNRLMREIAIMSELKSHPNIVSCEDYVVDSHEGKIGWDILIRMELLIPLADYQMNNKMDETTVRRLADDICEALVFCQKKGLIHRDIKPANLFADELGRFKLGDFGVARVAEKTIGGYSIQGTENYMAPEVYLGRSYGATVDIYSLGLVLYRLMNGGRLPFYPASPKPIKSSDRENALTARMKGDLMPPPCNASEEFAAIILKACAYDPKDRYRTAAEMLSALKKLDEIHVGIPKEGDWTAPDTESEVDEDRSMGVAFGKKGGVKPDELSEEQADIQDETIGIRFGGSKGEGTPEQKDEKEPEKKEMDPEMERTPTPVSEQRARINPVALGLCGLAVVVVAGSVFYKSTASSDNKVNMPETSVGVVVETTAVNPADKVIEGDELPPEATKANEFAGGEFEQWGKYSYENIDSIQNPGENQVNREVLSDDETILISGHFFEDLKEEELLNQMAVLRKRLDILGTPYAIGYEDNDKKDVNIRISPERLGHWMFELFGTSELRLRFPAYEHLFGEEVHSFEYRWDGEHWVVTVTRDANGDVLSALSNNTKLDIEFALGDLVLGKQSQAEVLNFVVQDSQKAMVTYEIALDCFADKAEQEKYGFVLDLMKAIVEEPIQTKFYLGYSAIAYGNEEELEFIYTPTSGRYRNLFGVEYGTEEDEQLLSAMKNIDQNVKVNRTETASGIVVYLDERSRGEFRIGKNYYDWEKEHEYVLDIFQKAYEAWDFNASSYYSVTFCSILSEDGEDYEYSLTFKRSGGELLVYSTESPDAKKIFEDAIKESDFWGGKIDSESPYFR